MVHSARKPPTMVKVQPAAYRNTGTPTTNHTSRAPNSATRAAASRLMPRFLANSSFADFDALLLPISRGTKHDAHQHQRQQARHGPQRPLEAQRLQQQPPRKKPTPFIAFLLPVKKATHLNSCPEACRRR
jgi:hypothetical protein